MKAKVTKYRPKFEITLSAEEVVHLEAALDFANQSVGHPEYDRLTGAFGIFEDEQSDDLMYKLWRAFNNLRDDVMTSGGLDDE